MFDCDQLVVGPTNALGGTPDLLMTDVPDLVRVAVVAPIGNSDHSSLSTVILMTQAGPNFIFYKAIRTLQLCSIAISLLLAQPMHGVERLTS